MVLFLHGRASLKPLDPMEMNGRMQLVNYYHNSFHFILVMTFFTSCGSITTDQAGGPQNGAGRAQTGGIDIGHNNEFAGNQARQSTRELLPPGNDIAAIRPVPGVDVAYDFNGTLSRDAKTAAVVRMILQGQNLKISKRVNVKGTLVNLRGSSQRQLVDRDVDVRDGGILDFPIQNLNPDTVYRLEGVTLTDLSQAGQYNVTTTVKAPYFLATTNESQLSKARRRLALQALSEAYDWDHRNYDSSKQYARGWGWCDYFYTWAAAKEFNVRAGSGSTYFFRRYNSLSDATKIPTIAQTANMAGDLIRYEGTSEGTHTFMIIAYDMDTQSLWNVEGNYNRRVMRSQRKIRSNWMHGHLSENQVK
jgi:hypothetical protein